jgi:hypothetical protein
MATLRKNHARNAGLSALAHSMIREFGDRALDVAQAEHARAGSDAAGVWDSLSQIIERKIADREFHNERKEHAMQLAAVAATPAARKLHLQRARLHAARAQNG